MDNIGRVNVQLAWVLVLVLIFILAAAPTTVACGLRGVVLDDLLRVDVLEDATVLYCVTRSRMELAWTLQSLVVVVLVVMMTSEHFDHVDLMVVIVGPLTPKVVMVVTAPIPSFPPFLVVIAARITTIESPIVVMVVISSRRVVGLLASSNVFSDQFFRVMGVGIVLGGSEKLGNRGRPFTK